jgi:hypothetical protein
MEKNKTGEKEWLKKKNVIVVKHYAAKSYRVTQTDYRPKPASG